MLAESAPVLCVPAVARVPANLPPEPVHEVALIEDQLNVELLPLATLLGLVLRETVGGVESTETVAEFEALPPAPVQLSTNWVVALKTGVGWLPLVGSVPVQPFEPVQEVAFVADQVSVEALPLVIVVGLAEIVTTGAAELTETVADCDALPPAPVHASV